MNLGYGPAYFLSRPVQFYKSPIVWKQSLVGRTLAACPLSGLCPTPLPRPICPETPFNTDRYVTFFKHELYPVYRVLLYHEIGPPPRHVEPSKNGGYQMFTGRRPRFAVWFLFSHKSELKAGFCCC